MPQLFLEYSEENFNYQNEDTEDAGGEPSFTSIKQFAPKCLYINPIEEVDCKIIDVDFDPTEKEYVHLHCIIASILSLETQTEEEDMSWTIPCITRTRREALQIVQDIQTEQIDNINGVKFPWNKEGVELEEIDIIFLPLEV